MELSRRQFIALVASVAAATGLPEGVVAQQLAQADAGALAAAAALTTLAQTLVPGTATDLGYRTIASGPGEPHIVREDAVPAQDGRAGRRQSVLCVLHLTDQHIVDCQSPARVEFLDRFVEASCPPPFESAWRPQEAASARIADGMLRRVRALAISPITGAPIAAAVCTGDNTDNQQANEAQVFLTVMDGGLVTPGSGDQAVYEGVQVSGDLAYWHPDPAVEDRYKTTFGFPSRPGFLEEALAPFTADGIGLPWYTAYGNHDGLVQGNAPANPAFDAVATGGAKVNSPPPANPCVLEAGEVPIMPPGAAVVPTTPDPERRLIDRAEYARMHLASPGLPTGHGLTEASERDGVVYYGADVGPLRFIVLDTVNPGGAPDGSVGDAQLAWLETELAAADAAGRPAVLWSHHGLRSLTNPAATPDPSDPEGSDLPRHLADDVLAVCQAHKSLILWVNGHTHRNTIGFQPGPQGGFWDVGTAAHIDWPPQSRILEVVDNADGTLSIFTTVLDLDVRDPVVAFARELMANDPQAGFGAGEGEAIDRNAELLIGNPFSQTGPLPTPAPTPAPTPQTGGQPGTGGAGGATGGGSSGTGSGGTSAGTSGAASSGGSRAVLPATGEGRAARLTVGGALLLSGAAGLQALRRRPRP